VCGQHHAPAAFNPGKEPVPIVQEAGWAPEPVWIGGKNLAPDLPARNESLYRLSYRGSVMYVCMYVYIYINSTNIPPIMIINRIYETQNLLSL
jgi:hypothetical protein